jgi:hypothetical protein
VRVWRADDLVDLLLHDRDTREAPGAEHPDAEPYDPEARDECDRKASAAEPACASPVCGDEDRTLSLGGGSFSFDDCHLESLRLENAPFHARKSA